MNWHLSFDYKSKCDELALDLMGNAQAIVNGLRLAGALAQAVGIYSRIAGRNLDNDLVVDLVRLINITRGDVDELVEYEGKYLKIAPMGKAKGLSMKMEWSD